MKLIGILIVIIGFVGMIALEMLLKGFVLIKLWSWFIVSHFGLDPLSIPIGLGLSLVISLLTYQGRHMKNHELDVAHICVSAFLNPLIALFVGWIITLFM